MCIRIMSCLFPFFDRGVVLNLNIFETLYSDVFCAIFVEIDLIVLNKSKIWKDLIHKLTDGQTAGNKNI